MRILALSGALHESSANRSVLQLAVESAPPGIVVVADEWLGRLPLFNPDLERETPHPVVAKFREAVAASDALLITCPEYGFSLPGVLKNGIDWLIGSGELEKKVIATTAIVAGPLRGQRGLDALHVTLNAVNARVIGGVPIVVPHAVHPASPQNLREEIRQLLERVAQAYQATLVADTQL